jgi:DNA-binding HxlR family transcriptional regulator
MVEASNDLKCPVGRAAAIIGGRWTALIIRDLLLKKSCRYQDLLDSLGGIASNTLSDRLKMLEDHGIIERRMYEHHPPRAEYLLTEKGLEFAPVLRAMRKWGDKYSGSKS